MIKEEFITNWFQDLSHKQGGYLIYLRIREHLVAEMIY